jgi:lichenan operon transcriptional antiterminator
MILRIKSNNYIKVTEIKTDREVMQIVNRMSEELEEHYDIAISKGEKQYLYMHMIANTHIDVEDINDDRLSESIQTMFQVIYDSYNFDLRSDEILRKDLFRHLKSIFASKTYALNRKNPLLDTIKKNYPLAFEVTLTSASQAFVREPYTLDEGDVGYVSLHIGAAIERCFSKTMSKKKVLLVCGSGHATTRMLETRLGLYFQDKINIVQCCSYNEFSTYKKNDLADIDFVISTISIKCDWIPVIVVNFSLTNQDVETISRFLTKIAVNKVQKTGHFFDKQLFFRMPRVAG